MDCGVCATCGAGCPAGFSCGGEVCKGGNLQQIKLNIETVPISGVVTLNGQQPQFGAYCNKNSSSKYLRARFVEVKKDYQVEV